MKLAKMCAVMALAGSAVAFNAPAYADMDMVMGMTTGISNGSMMGNIGAAMYQDNQTNQQMLQNQENDDEATSRDNVTLATADSVSASQDNTNANHVSVWESGPAGKFLSIMLIFGLSSPMLIVARILLKEKMDKHKGHKNRCPSCGH